MSEGDLDSFFARKDKKKKGQSGDRKKAGKSNKLEGVDVEGNNGVNNNTDNDEWGTIQDDLSKSVMTVDTNIEQENGLNGESKPSSDIHTITEEDSNSPGGDQSKQSGPWKVQQSPEGTNEENSKGGEAPIPPQETSPTQGQASASTSSAGGSGPNKYVAPRLRNKMNANSSGATSSSSMQGSISVHATLKVNPPDVKSQSDFPTLAAASSNSPSVPAVNENPWQRSQSQSQTSS